MKKKEIPLRKDLGSQIMTPVKTQRDIKNMNNEICHIGIPDLSFSTYYIPDFAVCIAGGKDIKYNFFFFAWRILCDTMCMAAAVYANTKM